MSGHEIKIPDFEQHFSRSDQQTRFPSLCNAVILAETRRPLPTIPNLDDAPGADGGFDGSWTLPLDNPDSMNAAPFAVPGWNAFQYKTRSNAEGHRKAFSQLKSSVRGAVRQLIDRAGRPGELKRYTLFTNLRLGPPEESRSAKGKRSVGGQRAELIAAIREGLSPDAYVPVEIIDAAFLQAAVNHHPPVRETFFGVRIFQTWAESWKLLEEQKHGSAIMPVIGRGQQLTDLQALRADPVVRFIGISGASGMGKTRLVLEATRVDTLETFFVRGATKDAFLGSDLAAYASAQRRAFVVEDLRYESAMRLAQQALQCENVCIIATIPAEEHLPELRFGTSPAVRLVRLPPLNNDEAKKLLDSLNAKIDRQAASWLIQEAGGNPQVILAAAERGSELRRSAGEFKAQIAGTFLRRAIDLFSEGIRPVLDVLSVLSPFDSANESHLAIVNGIFGLSVTPGDLRNRRQRLESAGFLETSGRSGRELNVSPPLLAAFLLEQLLRDHPERGLTLFEHLDEDGRYRLLERLISVDRSDDLSLWTHLFGSAGPFADEAAIERNVDLLSMLARAAPRQTASFLVTRAPQLTALIGRPKHNLSRSLSAILANESELFKENQRLDTFRDRLRGILRELAYHGDGSRDALKVLEVLASLVPSEVQRECFGELFAECFVYWISDFPLPPAERWPIVLRLLASKRSTARKLGRRALFAITDAPHSLSGAGYQRRRIMDSPPALLWRDIHQYLSTALALHVKLARAPSDGQTEAAEKLSGALFQALKSLPPAQLIPILRDVVAGYFDRRIKISPVDLLSRVTQLQTHFSDLLEKRIRDDWAAQLPAFVSELEQIVSRFLCGPLPLRLELWVDRNPSYGLTKNPVTGEWRYKDELTKLAKEIVAAPQSFTPAMRQQLVGEHATQKHEFALALGTVDRGKSVWRRLVPLMGTHGGDWVFAWYCLGLSAHDAAFVNRFLDRKMRDGRRTQTLLAIIKVVGPSAENRRRLQEIIRTKDFPPIEIGRMFTGGRWLDDLPPREVLAVLRYIAADTSETCTDVFLQTVVIYMHGKARLPALLVPVLRTLVCRTGSRFDHNRYRDDVASMVAKVSLKTGLAMLRRLLKPHIRADWARNPPGWNPLDGPDAPMNFFRYLREMAPRAAYGEALRYLKSSSRTSRIHHDTPLFDLETHATILLSLAKDDKKVAVALAANIHPKQAGFWPVAHALVEADSDYRIRNILIEQCVVQYGFGEYSDPFIVGIGLIEKQLATDGLTTPGRAWLEAGKADLARRLADARAL